MRHQTSQKLREIMGYRMFQAVGQPIAGEEVIPLKSWAEAAKHCGSKAVWERCQLMTRNALSRMARQRNWEHASHWNEIVEEIKTTTHPWLTTVCPPLESEEATVAIRNSVAWDTLMICMEVEFSDILPPLFYVPHLDPWYQRGHFPCGWEGAKFPDGWNGVMPQGKLVVF